MYNTTVSIIIVNYIKWEDTVDCLESLFRSTFVDFKMFVIDNNSPNESMKHLLEWADGKNFNFYNSEEFKAIDALEPISQINLIQNPTNIGFAAANNIVLSKLRNTGGFAWLLNPDMVVKENTLDELLKFSQGQPVQITGATVKSFNDDNILFYGGGTLNFKSAKGVLATNADMCEKLDYISGSCLFTRMENFIRFGLLPEEYFLYWEETDWCYNAKNNGAQLSVAIHAICYDKVSTVIGKGFLAHYYYTRNGLRFISKYRKKNLTVAVLSMGVRFFRRLLTGDREKAKGIYRGTVDFLKKRMHAIQ